MYRLNLQTTHQEQQEQQQSSSPSSQSHIFVPKEQIEQRQATTKAILSHNIILQKSSHDITTKTTTTTTKLNVLETNTTKTGGVTATPADLTLPHLIRICGTKSGVVAAAAAVASSTPTLNTHTININTDPLRVPLPRGETVCSSGGVEGENMTSDINNEKLSEQQQQQQQQQQNTFLRQSNDMDKISVVGRDATTSVVMAASIEDKLKYLAALKTESILNEIMTTTETITTKTITTATATTPTTHFKKRHSKNEALGIAIVGGVGVNSLENTKYLENMAADLSISKGSSTASTDAVNSSNAILSGAPTISLSMESKPLYASNVVVLSGDSLDGVSNGACLLAYEATKRPRLDSSPKHWLPTSSPVSGATCSSVPPLSPSSVSQSQSLSANMTNEYASPLSVGSYDAFSPGGKTGRDDLSPSSSLNGYATNENCDAKKSKKGPAPRLQEELCLVCGDRASGYHYNALTCEGCKGFFRRSVTKNASYCCKFGHACEMDMYMRRKCQECRLKKCLAVGMRPECVVPETQCIIKRREKKAQKEKDKQQASPMSNSNDFVKKEILELMSCEPPTHQTFPLLPDDVLAKCQARNIPPLTHNQLSVIYKLIWYQDGYEQPSEEDLKRIMSSPDEDETQHDMGFRHITEITILTVQLIVEFAKGLPAFTRIPQEDQITLLKACSSEVMMLRMARRYDYSTDSIFFANNRSYNRDTYKMAGVADNIEDLLHFCRQMYAMKVDNVEYALVTAIVIFSDRPGLEEAELVEAIQNYYIDTLRIYILNRHCGDPKSIVFFAKLLSILTELRTLGNQNAEMCFSLKLKNRKLPKFLEEIWDVHTIPPSVQSHIQSSNGQPTTNIQKPTLPESSTIQQQQQQQQQQNHHQQQQQQQHSHTQHSHTHVLTHNSTLASTSAEAQQQQMLHNIKVESSPLAPTNMSLSSNGSPIGLNGSEYSDVSPGMPMMGMVIDQDNLMGGDSGTGTAA